MDLAPAKWIWLPSERTLACTFVLFRREIEVTNPAEARGWIVADSRYRLTVNGQRVQWGPAPHDPRYAEADQVDLSGHLTEGTNCIGVEVLFFGHGDGTWPFGKPGLLMRLEIDGKELITDAGWKCIVDRSHPPGQFARWFLRALQEHFDARLHPVGWDMPGFDDSKWLAAQVLNNQPDCSAFAGGYKNYLNEIWLTDQSKTSIIERTIPFMREEWHDAKPRFLDRVTWQGDPRDWFEFRTPGLFTLANQPVTETVPVGAQAVTYELQEEMVGWPGFAIEASEGTVVELMIQESHDHATSPWLDTHIYAWSQFICREGVNQFETFDFEAGRWLQLHVHEHTRPVTITRVGMRRRTFPWPRDPAIEVGDEALQKVFNAALNTIDNSAQETIVDGMGRERQQYSGDGSHQLHPIRYAYGETCLPARFLRTFAQGQLIDGVFADSWPAVDRLQRLWERNVDASDWGPLLDHSVGFIFDHYHHWMQSGDLEPTRQNWSRLVRFVDYLRSIQDGLLPVENLGVNAVWIDHDAFLSQGSKQCSFNLYVIAMLRDAFLLLAAALGEEAGEYRLFADDLLANCVAEFWNVERQMFGYLAPDGTFRTDDRALSTAVLYDLCPLSQVDASVQALAERPKFMGQSYPANMVWNYWALAKAGRIQPVLDDLRARWAPMRSVVEANALQEFWTTKPDATNLMSHCPLAPLTLLYQGIVGLWPTKPAFEEMVVWPQLGDIESLSVTAHTPQGEVWLEAEAGEIRISVPAKAVVRFGDHLFELGAGESVSLSRR